MAAHSHRRRSACPRRRGRRGHRDGTVLAEETPHRGAGPRTPRITERLTGGTAGPRVTQPGHQPHLQSAATTRQRPSAHQVSATTACRCRPGRVGGPGPRLADSTPGGRPGVRREPLIGDALRVLGIDGAVRRPLEDDHRGHWRNGDHGWRGGSAPHGEDGVGRTGRGPVWRRGVHADSGKHLRVRCRQHHGHRSTGRKAGDVHPARVDTPRRGFGCHPAHDPGENCRFALRPKLVRRAEPVPAPLWVVRRGLFRIHHDESVLVGQLVQPRAGGEIHRRLCAPMQGEQQRSAGGAAQPERDVYAVTPGTSQAGVAKLTPRAAPGPAVFRRLLPCRIGRGPCPLDGGLSGPGLGGSREHLDGRDLDARSRRPALARPCRARDERLHEGGPGRPARSSSWHVILPLSGTAGDERGFPATDHRRCGPPDGTGVRRMAGRPTSLATPGSRLAHPRRDLSGKGGAEPPGVCDAPESVSDVCECPRSGYGNDIGPA